jgi:hypothetical protein
VGCALEHVREREGEGGRVEWGKGLGHGMAALSASYLQWMSENKGVQGAVEIDAGPRSPRGTSPPRFSHACPPPR